MASISGSVGQGGINKEQDVLTVQKLLNKHVAALGLKRLKEDGDIGIHTIGAIRKYQADILGKRLPDGRVDVGGGTWKALHEGRAAQVARQSSAAKSSPGTARWVYDQSAGSIALDGRVVAFGYAGKGKGKNNPDLQHVQKTGPIPVGLWRMVQKYKSPNTGPHTIILEPEPGTQTFGRSLFRVHGDNQNHTASEGCIILPPAVRLQMWSTGSQSRLIEVVR